MKCELRKNWNKNECKKSVGESEFRIIVPKRDNSKKPIKQDILKKYITKMNKIFGGSTVIPKTAGCYYDNNNKFFCENSFMIVGVRDFETPYDKELRKLNMKQREKKLEDDYMKVKSLGRKMSKELGQDSVFVEQATLKDASMVKRRKTWKASLPRSKTGKKEIFSEY